MDTDWVILMNDPIIHDPRQRTAKYPKAHRMPSKEKNCVLLLLQSFYFLCVRIFCFKVIHLQTLCPLELVAGTILKLI